MILAKKSLGQHWLNDSQALAEIVKAADIKAGEQILEIGPGQGSLTKLLLSTDAHVIAVEVDRELFNHLQKQTADNLKLVNQDILEFDFDQLTQGYKVVANIPYYLTNHLLRTLVESNNPPAAMVLLVQKEVAERICAEPGQMSVLAVSLQLDYDCQLGVVVPAELFEPPPKIDSQVVVAKRRGVTEEFDRQLFFRIVKAGFSNRRKKLRSSLAGGLAMTKPAAEELLAKAGVDSNRRAQDLSVQEWKDLYKAHS